jgi:tetratricopeptide (TPR) repeat protein
MFKFYEKKIILISMIKNEEKIIRRCIDSVKNICDAFCISDTMSTDNTVKVVEDYIEEQNNLYNIPGKIYQNTWKNFGVNRTISYINTIDFCVELGWDLNNTYGLLLDADMKLVVNPSFNKQDLTHNGYRIIQDNNHIDYQNTRFVKLNKSWKCTGVTHEYWDGPGMESISKDKIFIHDIGDGGCKSDKFERDMKLLITGIEEEPKNDRYHFYLAQTLKDLGKFKESIAFYKRRIELGGWNEEVWYSHYMVAKNWLSLGNLIKCEAWAMKAYEFRKNRPEPLYLLVNLFRDKGQHFKAYHYYRIAKNIPETNDVLFVEKNIPNYLLDYEYTILHYWLFPNEKLVGLKATINYLNKTNHNEDNVLSNMDFYLQKLDGELIEMKTPLLDMYCASSPSIINYNDKTIVNLRYVNYRIQTDGSYMMYDKGTLSRDHHVKTKNALVYLDDKFNFINDPVLLDETITDIPIYNTWIHGLEDLRLFQFQDKLYYTATTREYSYNGNNRIVFGEYDIENKKYNNNKVLYPPTETDCEKNWIPIINNQEVLFIYKWHPLEIGKLDEKNKLNIIIKHDTPSFFKHYRGSSSVCEYNNQYWCITHGVKYTTPRRYYHQFVVFDKTTLKPVNYSVPFYFNNFKIEYCNGMMIKGKEVTIIFSQNDMNPCIMKTDMDRVKRFMVKD